MTKVVMPKVNVKMDWSKLNLRKFNWITVMGILSYLYLLALIPMVFGRKSSFVQFHVGQGVRLLFVWVLFFFSFYLPVLPMVIALYIVFAIVWGIVSVATGKEKPLPLIGNIATE